MSEDTLRGFIASPHCVWSTCICPLDYAPPSQPQGIICSTPQIPAECLRMRLRLLFRARMPNITHPPAFEHVFAVTPKGSITRGSLPLKLRKNPKDTALAVSFGSWWRKRNLKRIILVAIFLP